MRFKTNLTLISGTIIGLAICLMMWVGASAILASVVINNNLQMDTLIWVLRLLQGVIVFIGCWVAGALLTERKHLACALCGTTYIVVMVSFDMLFCESMQDGFLLGILSIIIGAIAASLVLAKKKAFHHIKKINKRIR